MNRFFCRLGVSAVLILFLSVFSASVSYAEDFSEYMDNRAVNVIESENSIDIYAYISITGSIADKKVLWYDDTYAQIFIKGVIKAWTGSYKGKSVTVNIQHLADDDKRRHVRVIIESPKSEKDFSCASKHENTIWMYSGDGRCGPNSIYSYNGFMYVAGHEFSHILGLADAYSDKNELIQKYLITPLGAWNCSHAQDVDYYLLLKYQTWKQDGYFAYSCDGDVLRWLSKNILCEEAEN